MVLQKFKVNRYDIVSSIIYIKLEPFFQTINIERLISITKILKSPQPHIVNTHYHEY